VLQLRQLLDEYKDKRANGNRDPDLLRNLRKHHFPELPDVNTTDASDELKERLAKIAETRQQIDVLRKQLAEWQASKGDEAQQGNIEEAAKIEAALNVRQTQSPQADGLWQP
jgi:hypothetical protein